jgi:hypothetical protein
MLQPPLLSCPEELRLDVPASRHESFVHIPGKSCGERRGGHSPLTDHDGPAPVTSGAEINYKNALESIANQMATTFSLYQLLAEQAGRGEPILAAALTMARSHAQGTAALLSKVNREFVDQTYVMDIALVGCEADWLVCGPTIATTIAPSPSAGGI